MHQEMIEILYHTLWETVHVFFEHRELGHDVGDAGIPLSVPGPEKQDTTDVVAEVADSILMKVQDDAKLRAQVAREQAEQIGNAALAIHERLQRGGKLILFGNGGSATDANDWAIDCVLPPAGYRPIPAVSLALEPANITAVANDVGTEVIFLRQLIAQARPEDVAVGISTSGGSRNIIMALEEARKRNMLTVALLGYDGGEIMRRGLADFPMVVRSRLHSAHSGSAGFDLPHHPRSAGGTCTVAKLELYGTARAPTPRRCAIGWSGSAASSSNTTSKPIRGSRACASSPAGSAPCPFWSKTAASGWQGHGCIVDEWRSWHSDRLAGTRVAICESRSSTMASARSIRVRGVVQGVGFRPSSFAWRARTRWPDGC